MTTLTAKLQAKAGQTLAVLNAPAGYRERLAAELEGLTLISDSSAGADGVLLFVSNLDEARCLVPAAFAALPAGLLWVAYPKGSSKVKTDVNRDRLWEAIEPTGWRPVRQVALDDVWSAMRFRPAELVGR